MTTDDRFAKGRRAAPVDSYDKIGLSSIGGPPAARSSESTFSDLKNEVAQSRRRATRVLARQRLRRRVVPPLMVGSTVLLGGGLSAAWVNTTLHAPAATSGATTPSASWTAATARAHATELLALDHVRRALAADSQIVSSLSNAARQALVADSKTTVVNEVAPTTGGSTGPPASGGSLAALSSPASPGVTSLPALAPLPPMPSLSIPSTQGTTGATHVVP